MASRKRQAESGLANPAAPNSDYAKRCRNNNTALQSLRKGDRMPEVQTLFDKVPTVLEPLSGLPLQQQRALRKSVYSGLEAATLGAPIEMAKQLGGPCEGCTSKRQHNNLFCAKRAKATVPGIWVAKRMAEELLAEGFALSKLAWPAVQAEAIELEKDKQRQLVQMASEKNKMSVIRAAAKHDRPSFPSLASAGRRQGTLDFASSTEAPPEPATGGLLYAPPGSPGSPRPVEAKRPRRGEMNSAVAALIALKVTQLGRDHDRNGQRSRQSLSGQPGFACKRLDEEPRWMRLALLDHCGLLADGSPHLTITHEPELASCTPCDMYDLRDRPDPDNVQMHGNKTIIFNFNAPGMLRILKQHGLNGTPCSDPSCTKTTATGALQRGRAPIKIFSTDGGLSCGMSAKSTCACGNVFFHANPVTGSKLPAEAAAAIPIPTEHWHQSTIMDTGLVTFVESEVTGLGNWASAERTCQAATALRRDRDQIVYDTSAVIWWRQLELFVGDDAFYKLDPTSQELRAGPRAEYEFFRDRPRKVPQFQLGYPYLSEAVIKAGMMTSLELRRRCRNAEQQLVVPAGDGAVTLDHTCHVAATLKTDKVLTVTNEGEVVSFQPVTSASAVATAAVGEHIAARRGCPINNTVTLVIDNYPPNVNVSTTTPPSVRALKAGFKAKGCTQDLFHVTKHHANGYNDRHARYRELVVVGTRNAMCKPAPDPESNVDQKIKSGLVARTAIVDGKTIRIRAWELEQAKLQQKSREAVTLGEKEGFQEQTRQLNDTLINDAKLAEMKQTGVYFELFSKSTGKGVLVPVVTRASGDMAERFMVLEATLIAASFQQSFLFDVGDTVISSLAANSGQGTVTKVSAGQVMDDGTISVMWVGKTDEESVPLGSLLPSNSQGVWSMLRHSKMSRSQATRHLEGLRKCAHFKWTHVLDAKQQWLVASIKDLRDQLCNCEKRAHNCRPAAGTAEHEAMVDPTDSTSTVDPGTGLQLYRRLLHTNGNENLHGRVKKLAPSANSSKATAVALWTEIIPKVNQATRRNRGEHTLDHSQPWVSKQLAELYDSNSDVLGVKADNLPAAINGIRFPSRQDLEAANPDVSPNDQIAGGLPARFDAVTKRKPPSNGISPCPVAPTGRPTLHRVAGATPRVKEKASERAIDRRRAVMSIALGFETLVRDINVTMNTMTLHDSSALELQQTVIDRARGLIDGMATDWRLTVTNSDANPDSSGAVDTGDNCVVDMVDSVDSDPSGGVDRVVDSADSTTPEVSPSPENAVAGSMPVSPTGIQVAAGQNKDQMAIDSNEGLALDPDRSLSPITTTSSMLSPSSLPSFTGLATATIGSMFGLFRPDQPETQTTGGAVGGLTGMSASLSQPLNQRFQPGADVHVNATNASPIPMSPEPQHGGMDQLQGLQLLQQQQQQQQQMTSMLMVQQCRQYQLQQQQCNVNVQHSLCPPAACQPGVPSGLTESGASSDPILSLLQQQLPTLPLLAGSTLSPLQQEPVSTLPLLSGSTFQQQPQAQQQQVTHRAVPDAEPKIKQRPKAVNLGLKYPCTCTGGPLDNGVMPWSAFPAKGLRQGMIVIVHSELGRLLRDKKAKVTRVIDGNDNMTSGTAEIEFIDGNTGQAQPVYTNEGDVAVASCKVVSLRPVHNKVFDATTKRMHASNCARRSQNKLPSMGQTVRCDEEGRAGTLKYVGGETGSSELPEWTWMTDP